MMESGARTIGKEAILRKVRALQKLTVENGASEYEAVAAAEAAHRLTLKLGLAESIEPPEVKSAKHCSQRKTARRRRQPKSAPAPSAAPRPSAAFDRWAYVQSQRPAERESGREEREAFLVGLLVFPFKLLLVAVVAGVVALILLYKDDSSAVNASVQYPSHLLGH